jgi:NodT family efflux transporter outer membrane factor (OMF) lipoprotein
MTLTTMLRPLALPPLLLAAALAAGCASLPGGDTPVAPMQAAYKEAPPGWTDARPLDAIERGAWWTVFNDAELDAMAERVQVDNQNIAAAAAAVAQAQGAYRESRAGLFPSVGLSGGATRSGGEGASSSGSGGGGTRFQASVGASWEPDLWGRLRGGASAAASRAQASEADLASARLSALGQLAGNYFKLRDTDIEAALLRETVDGYQRVVQITQNRYDAGVAPKSDLLQAQTQLANAQADLATLQQDRAQLEHALAVLQGLPPAQFSLAPRTAALPQPPRVPLGVPSTLLQRRPDIAAAQRRVAAANAQIGVARAGYFPSLSLSASTGGSAARLADLFSANVWSLGLSIAQVVFDAGATGARVDQARAGWEQAVAQYRQTVLGAFQDVEDQLATLKALQQQQALREQAAQAATLTEQQVFNRYRAGQVSFSEVVQAQVTALSARRALAALAASRQVATVALIQALGGGWQGLPP